MSNPATASPSLHPVLWIAGIAVTLFSVVGIASLAGLLPSRSATPPADPPAVVAQAPAAVPASAVPAVLTAAPATAAPAAPATEQPSAPVAHKKTAKHKAHEVAALPPPAGAGVPPDYAPPPTAVPAAPSCASCGVIANIREVTHEGPATGLGAVGGGLIGGAIANNVGQGNGRTLATIAGMVGGGLLGNKIEKSQHRSVSYHVSVHMEDGTSQLVSFDTAPPWRVGDPVKVVNGTLVAR
jgi:outer membrane lipoprotein SlyB